jgi:hypothetical protein
MTNPRPIPVPKAAVGQLGGYALADLKAPTVPVPSKNKAIELGNNLNKFFGVATQYASLAEEEFSLYQKQLARRSPEEIEASKQKTEDELDKLVRRDAIGWMTSPLNRERKLRAEGKLLGRDLISEIQQRLINPKAGDPQDLTERANLVRQEYIENTPALQSSMFTQEGLNEVTTAQIEGLISGAEAREAAIAKSETLFATGASIYDKIETLIEKPEIQTQLRSGDFSFAVETLPDGSVVTLGDFIQQQWAETGAYTAKEQRAQLEKVLNNMATNGMGDQADGLLLWAKSNLKFGNAKMTSMEFDELEFLIDNAAEAEEERRDKDNIEFVKNTTGEHKVQLAKLNMSEDNQITYDGQQFTDKLALDEYFKRKVIDNPDLSPEQKGQIIDNITATTQGSFRDAETHTKNLVLREAPIATVQGFQGAINSILSDSLDIPTADKNLPEFTNIINNNLGRLRPLIDKKLDEVLALPTDKAAAKVTAYVRELLQDETPKIQAELRTAYDNLLDKRTTQRQGVPLGEKAEKPKLPEPDDDPEELIKLLPQWQSFITEDATDENSNKAKKYIEKYTPQIANETAKLALDPTRFISGRETIPSMFLIDPDQAINLHLQYSARMDGVFTVDVLENLDDKGLAYTYAGIPFKPKELIGDVNADKVVILSQEQLDNTDTPEGLEVARRAKEAAGITLDVYEFIRLQKKRRKQFIVDYVPMPDMYRPLDVNEELKKFIETPTPEFDPFPDILLIDY